MQPSSYPSYQPPQGKLGGTFPGLGQTPEPLAQRKKPKRDKGKLLFWTLMASGGLLLMLVIAAVVLASLAKAPAPAAGAPQTTQQYYYGAGFGPDPASPGSYAYTLGRITPAGGQIQSAKFTFPQAIAGATAAPLQFSANGKRYVYTDSSATAQDAPGVAKPQLFQLITGTMPQKTATEKILVSNTARGDNDDWLLTADGTEVVYIQTVTSGPTSTSQTLYSINTATGKSTKIGSVSRPLAADNTHLQEVVAAKTVSFYTAMDDGIYQTRYDRASRSLSTAKVVIKNYDPGRMGAVSPDGTKMLYFGGSAATANYTLYLLDLKEGGVTPLLKTPAKYGGYTSGLWSPDSKTAVITSQLQSVDGAHYDDQIVSVDAIAKTADSQTVLQDSTSPGTDNSRTLYTLTSWSPDGRYLTYIQNSTLYFYDMKQQQTVPKLTPKSPVLPQNPPLSGWITIGQ